ncbi:MAG: flagellar hook-length control protein FliK [Nitrospirae bacterium]|nr:flagellar hook-length control protein FliK [Nitrospirota bacterium]
MINFKITTLTDGNLSLEGTTGKSVQLTPGEMVKAEVLDVMPSGSVTLRIKGEVITAKTAVPLQQGETAYFKVSDSPAAPNELKLRFVGYEETPQDAAPMKSFMSSPDGRTLAGLIQELSDSLLGNKTSSAKNQSSAPLPAGDAETASQGGTRTTLSPDSVERILKQLLPSQPGDQSNVANIMKGDGLPGQGRAKDAQEIPPSPAKDQKDAAYMTKGNVAYAKNGQPDAFPLNKVESLLKALPPDINALPKEIKTQLQDLLAASLKTTGESIQSRLATVSSQISDALKNSPAAQNFKADTMLNMDRLLSAPLKNALLNTGVAFEAKLKSVVVQMQLDASPADAQTQGKTGGLAGLRDLPQQIVGDLADLQKLPPQGADNPAGTQDLLKNTEQINVAERADPKTQAEVKVDDKTTATHGESQVSDIRPKTHDAIPALRNDLKAVLLELKQRLSAPTETSQPAQDSKAPAAATETAHTATLKNLQGKIEGLLKDVETFQALSKTTDSFYTFLPVDWKALKDGEVSFKRGRTGAGGGGASSSCRINLDLHNFGNLSVLVLMHNKDFFVSFKAASPDTGYLISTNLDELKSSFRERGLSLKAAHMLDKTDTSMEQIEGLGSSDRTISIKA